MERVQQLIPVVIIVLSIPYGLVWANNDENVGSGNSGDQGCFYLQGNESTPIEAIAMDVNPDFESLDTELTIGEVLISSRSVFDESNPAENHFLYRLANDYHTNTRLYVVRQQLLFKPGDSYAPRLLEESARLLRKSNYLYDARVVPYRVCGQRVDILVITRDIWTLYPSVSFSRSGGENKSGIGLEDNNILGTGNRVNFSYHNDDERSGYTFAYKTENLLGSRVNLRSHFSNNSDGNIAKLSLNRPFYALDARWAAGFGFNQEDREDTFYSKGEKADQFAHFIEGFDVYYGWSNGLVRDYTSRWRLGFTREAHTFEDIEFDSGFLDALPADRTYAYPWVNFERVENDYSIYSNLDTLHRTEDVHVGLRLNMKLGYAAKSLGSTANYFVFDSSGEDRLVATESDIIKHSFSLGGYWNTDIEEPENLLGEYRISLHHKTHDDRSLFAEFSLSAAKNLTSDNQMTLGGNSGLRGYDKNLRDGDRRMLFRLERRQFYNIHLFNLIYIGSAMFFDVGRIWHGGSDPKGEDGYLKDVGVGLRLTSSKAQSGRVVHLDFAYPLDDIEGAGGFQWLVTIKESF